MAKIKKYTFVFIKITNEDLQRSSYSSETNFNQYFNFTEFMRVFNLLPPH